ncbi:DUF5683 domain-containing protein [Spirosoma jeollabukense]
MKRFLTLLLACLLFCTAWPIFAQKPAIAPAPTPAAIDSTKQGQSATDTIPPTVQRNGIKVGTSVLTDDDAPSLDNPDTVQVTAKQEAQIHKIIPRKATLRSLMLPGLGQAYNRQYYKIPFIYVGFGVMGYLFVKYRGLAKEAGIGYERLLYGDKILEGIKVTYPPGTYSDAVVNPGPFFVPAKYLPVSEVAIGISPFSDSKSIFRTTANAKNAYDTFRRYRDLNLLLSGLLWVINIVEANVAAHLKTFDLTDDISMLVEPNVLPMPGVGFGPGVRVAFTFK